MTPEEEAFAIYNGLASDPQGTLARLNEHFGVSTVPDEYAEMHAWYEAQKAAQLEADELDLYDRTLDALLAQPANADIDRNLLHGFIAAAEGDYDRDAYGASAALRKTSWRAHRW